MSLAIADLERLAGARDKRVAYEVFAAYDLASEARPSYEELALRFDTSTSQITNYLAWARRELRKLALERLAALSVNEGEFRAEVRRLFAE